MDIRRARDLILATVVVQYYTGKSSAQFEAESDDAPYFGPPEVRKANAHLVPKKFGHGGRRVKSDKPDPLRWTHPDAAEIAKKIPLKARRRWLGLQEGFESWFWAA